MWLTDETGRTFEVKRTFNPLEDHPFDDGEEHDFSQLFPVLFLSQNEIIKIAESEEEQIAFLSPTDITGTKENADGNMEVFVANEGVL